MAATAHGQSATFQWIRQIGGSAGQSVAGMATDSQGNIYVAGSTSSVDFPTKSALQTHPGGSGLYRIDGPGAQFQSLYGSGFAAVDVLTVDPRNPSTLYAIGDRGLFRSADAGATWNSLGSFNDALTSVAVDPTASGVLYAGTRGQGILKSGDGGATWTAINNGIGLFFDGTPNVYGIWIDPRQPNLLYATAYTGLARSTDGGASWRTDTRLSQSVEVLDMAFDPNTPGLVYAATLGNLQKSTDNGITWTVLPPPSRDYGPRRVLLDPKHSGTLYTAGIFGGAWASNDSGNTWTNLLPGNVSTLVADPVTGALYAIANGNLLMSADGFQTTVAVGPVGVGLTSVAVVGTGVFAGAQAASDVYAVKYDPQGNVIYATYFGGTGNDTANGMAVDSDGSVYVTGTTNSADFPVSKGAYATSGGSFVFKLNADGSLGYSTYFAPTGTTPNAIAVDGAGHAFIAGFSYGKLPVTAGAYQSTLQGSYPCCNIIGPGPGPVSNAFLSEFDPGGASLIFSTYVGTLTAFAKSMVLAPDGNAILAGAGMLYRVKGDGSALLNSGSLPGVIWSLAVDGAGNIYAGGQAYNRLPPFPTSAGAFQTAVVSVPFLPGTMANIGDGDGFVTRLDSQFNILASTLIGGEAPDETVALAIAPNGNILAGGFTGSKAFPTRGAAQGSFATATGFVTELTPDLSHLVFSSYAGDTRQFVVTAIAPTADGGLLFVGATQSPPGYAGSFLGPPGGMFPAGGIQGFVVKAGFQQAAPRIDRAVNAASQLGVPLSPGAAFQVQGEGFGDDAVLLMNGSALPLLSQSRNALTAILPSDFSAPGAATVVVQSGGSSSSPYLAAVAIAAPGVFSVGGSGMGQGYILNQDGTMNSPDNPAKEGSPITICATGVGPIRFDGGYAVTASPVNVDIGGFYANGIAAKEGPVAGLPGNVYQISVYVPRPSDFAAGNPNLKNFVMPPVVAVSLEVNGARSQAGLALSVTH
jgi:uncharacterized protein (TIGR03437 family)